MKNKQKWGIAKTFECCYGHRVWTQELNTEFSLDSKCACRHLHGHQGSITIYLDGDKLNPQGMITDFKHLNWMKKLIDDIVDHKFIIDYSDPLFNTLLPDFVAVPLSSICFEPIRVDKSIIAYKPKLTNFDKLNMEDHMQEMYEGFTIVDFVPTSENLSKWLFNIASTKMEQLGVEVSRVQFFETPKSQANYYNPQG